VSERRSDLVCQAVDVELGRIGIWSSYRPFGIERASEAAKLAEQLGYAAWWVGGSPHVPDVRPVLEATSALVAATGILNVWINDPAAADAALRAEFPGRFMLGIGIGHPEATSDYRRPLTTIARVPGRSGCVAHPAAGRGALLGRTGAEDA
jgi:alkanesulfonate monooxygenase SsuD/methylene tetrahydromethanopterin reductase-like flavin-dependent oxidoreductase (luciferase family)